MTVPRPVSSRRPTGSEPFVPRRRVVTGAVFVAHGPPFVPRRRAVAEPSSAPRARLVAAAVLVAALLAAAVPGARAASSRVGSAGAVGARAVATRRWTFREVGLPGALQLGDAGGASAVRVLTLPLSDGLRPTTASVRARLPAGARSATLTFASGGTVLRTVVLRRPAARTVLISLPAPVGGAATVPLQVTTQVRAAGGACAGEAIAPTVRLDDGHVLYRGAGAAPRGAAGFLPDVLRRLVFLVPPHTSADERQAVADLTSLIVTRYARQPVRVEVLTRAGWSSAARAPSDPAAVRVIDLAEANTGRTVVVRGTRVPRLRIGGRGAVLSRRTAALVGDLALLERAGRASALRVDAPTELVRRRVTLDDLGLDDVRATGTGTLVAAVPFSLPDLGRPAGRLRAHLIGRHTPIPAGVGATLEVRWNGRIVRTAPATSAGPFHLDVALPDDASRRANDLRVLLVRPAPDGRCDPGGRPATLGLDPTSSIESVDGGPPADGFAAFPQALTPVAALTIAGSGAPELDNAVQLLTALQRLSRRPLSPRVVDRGSAMRTDTSATILVGRGAPAVGPRRGGAALEAFRTPDGRPVISLSWVHGASDARRLMGSIAARAGGLRDLPGDVAVGFRRGPVRVLGVRADRATATPGGADGGGSGVPLVLGGLVVVLITGGGSVLWRRRRSS